MTQLMETNNVIRWGRWVLAANAMFATAAVHAAVAVIGLVANLGPTLLADALWVAGWIASGLLFRQAGVTSASSFAPR